MKIVVIGNGMVGYKFCEKIITQCPGEISDNCFWGRIPARLRPGSPQ